MQIQFLIKLNKIIDSRKAAFPGEVISDFLQENKNYFPKLEEFANKVFDKIQKNNRTRYIALCEYLYSESVSYTHLTLPTTVIV